MPEIEYIVKQPIDTLPIRELIGSEDSAEKVTTGSPFECCNQLDPLLKQFQSKQSSGIFRKLWDSHGSHCIKQLGDGEKLTLRNIVEDIWQPSLRMLGEIKGKLTNLSMPLREITQLFSDIDDGEMKQELIILNGNMSAPWVEKCFQKLKMFRTVDKFKRGAAAVVKAGEALHWSGNLNSLQALTKLVCFYSLYFLSSDSIAIQYSFLCQLTSTR